MTRDPRAIAGEIARRMAIGMQTPMIATTIAPMSRLLTGFGLPVTRPKTKPPRIAPTMP